MIKNVRGKDDASMTQSSSRRVKKMRPERSHADATDIFSLKSKTDAFKNLEDQQKKK